jgi:hypothetical protein
LHLLRQLNQSVLLLQLLDQLRQQGQSHLSHLHLSRLSLLLHQQDR